MRTRPINPLTVSQEIFLFLWFQQGLLLVFVGFCTPRSPTGGRKSIPHLPLPLAAIPYGTPHHPPSLAGAGLLKYCISGQGVKTLGATTLSTGVNFGQGFTLETLMTFFLMNTILHTTDKYGGAAGMAPWAIGSTLTFCILMDGPLTGASLNPARTLGPNLFSGLLFKTNTIIYFTAPFLGAALAAGLWKVLAAMQDASDSEVFDWWDNLTQEEPKALESSEQKEPAVEKKEEKKEPKSPEKEVTEL